MNNTSKNESENDIRAQMYKLANDIMKFSDQLVEVLFVASLPFLLTLLLGNNTAPSVGLFILGCAITIKIIDMKDMKSKAHVIWAMWFVILVLMCVLLGFADLIPKMINSYSKPA